MYNLTIKSTWATIKAILDMPKLSNPSKMPCYSMSIPAQACKVGSILANIVGTVCSDCYALKGMYMFPDAKKLREHNLKLIQDNLAQWVVYSIILIGKSSLKNGYFRWFDSGDLQDVNHLKAIIEIALALPTIQFWMPTKEHNLLKDVFIRQGIVCPDNLIIRLSSNYIDQAPSTDKFLTSTVYSHGNQPIGQQCIAPSQDGKCLDCRACWNKSVQTISYAQH